MRSILSKNRISAVEHVSSCVAYVMLISISKNKSPFQISPRASEIVTHVYRRRSLNDFEQVAHKNTSCTAIILRVKYYMDTMKIMSCIYLREMY